MVSFGKTFEEKLDILILGVIAAASFQFLLNPLLNFYEKWGYSFITGTLLIFSYSFFEWIKTKNNPIKILGFALGILGILLIALLVKLSGLV